MPKAKVGLVGLTSHAESGGERAEEIFRKAKEELESRGLEVEAGKRMIWDSAD